MKDGAVLPDETMSLLGAASGGFYIDATAGEGFLAKKILDKIGKNGRLLMIDIDPFVIKGLRGDPA